MTDAAPTDQSSTAKSDAFTRPLAALGGERPPAPEWFEKALETPSKEAALTVRGAKIAYSVWGDEKAEGRGLLFIHGGRAHRNWWRPFAPFFSGERRVAALDLSGMGDSDWRDHYSLDCMVDEVFAVIEAAGLDRRGRPLVVGHSFGGWVTLAAVEREGDRLGGAVVVDSPLGVPDPNEGYAIHTPKNDGQGPRRPKLRAYADIAEPISRFRLLPDQPIEHLYIADYIAREGLKRGFDEAGSEGWMWKFDPLKGDNFEIHFERDLLRAARCPLAFLYGEKSAFATEDALRHLRDQARGRSPFIIVPEARHHIMIDQPVAFISILRTLLASWPVRAGS